MPFPVTDLRHILTVLTDIMVMRQELVAQILLDSGDAIAQLRKSVNHIINKMVAIQIVHHQKIEKRGSGPLFFVPTDMKVLVIGPSIG